MKQQSYLRQMYEYVGQTEGCLEGGREGRERGRGEREREEGIEEMIRLCVCSSSWTMGEKMSTCF